MAKSSEVQSLKQGGHGLKGTRRTEGADGKGFGGPHLSRSPDTPDRAPLLSLQRGLGSTLAPSRLVHMLVAHSMTVWSSESGTAGPDLTCSRRHTAGHPRAPAVLSAGPRPAQGVTPLPRSPL